MTRYADAIWRPGPVHKQGYPNYPNQNAIAGIVLHSMDGYYATGGVNVLDNGGTSWQFSITNDGTVYQHYELEACCWHSGNASQNRRTIGIEHEGVHSFRLDALTEAQIQASVKLCLWIAALPNAYALKRGETIFEHRDFGTSECPGERFTPIWSRWTDSQPDQSPGWSEHVPQPTVMLEQADVYPGTNERFRYHFKVDFGTAQPVPLATFERDLSGAAIWRGVIEDWANE